VYVAKNAERAGTGQSFYDRLKQARHHYVAHDVATLFGKVDKARVEALAATLTRYIAENLPNAIERRDGLGDYRTNPYVLMTSATVMNLEEPLAFASFLFNSKLYAGLETSFGKSIEAAFMGAYPLNSKTHAKWTDAPEKLTEFKTYAGLSREEKALRRTSSVWREIDKSCVVGDRRFLISIKSGPNCINDTQVQAMTRAIADHHHTWLAASKATYPRVKHLDIAIGITYGTDRTTNNKENQILAKLVGHGFEENDPVAAPGVLVDTRTRTVKVYRRVGQDFWSMVGDPTKPKTTNFVFLEVLLGLAKGLASVMNAAELEDRINARLQALRAALGGLMFPRQSLPDWIRDEFRDKELFWFATAMTAFFDEGI